MFSKIFYKITFLISYFEAKNVSENNISDLQVLGKLFNDKE